MSIPDEQFGMQLFMKLHDQYFMGHFMQLYNKIGNKLFAEMFEQLYGQMRNQLSTQLIMIPTDEIARLDYPENDT
jgi:hypothetical protein